MEYRFVGSETYVGEVHMTRFGQRFAITEELAADAQRGGAAILDEPTFQSIGFTKEDLRIWADPFMDLQEVPGDQAEAASKAAFLAKRAQAHELYRQTRARLLTPAPKATDQMSFHEEEVNDAQ